MKCSIEKVHALLDEAYIGEKDAAMQLCECFEDEMTKMSRILPEKIREDGKQRACWQIIIASTKNMDPSGFQKCESERCKE
jgi:hypothetical protein